MRTHLRLVAAVVARGTAGRTRLTHVSGEGGHLAARQTGPAGHAVLTVHLVATAAGPLGGDEVIVEIDVREGAALELRSAASTLVLPDRRGRPSRIVLDASVADGGRLDVALEPTVVCRGAMVAVETSLRVEAGGHARVIDEVVLGRHGEQGGDATSVSRVDVAGRPVLRSSVATSLLLPDLRGALSTAMAVGVAAHGARTTSMDDARAVATPLTGGSLSAAAWGRGLVAVRAALAEVTSDPGALARATGGTELRQPA